MKYRKLRIAWSVAWGVVAVLLCVLWVRSYWKCDYVECVSKDLVLRTIASNYGVVSVTNNFVGVPGVTTFGWKYESRESTKQRPDFRWTRTSSEKPPVYIHYWIMISIAAALGTIPWIHWSKRFSLRTLLIATTLVAVGLGIIMWMSRAG